MQHLFFCVWFISLSIMSSVISNLKKSCKKMPLWPSSDSLIVYICILSHLLYQSLLSYALSTYPSPPHNTPLSTSVCINQNTGNLALIWHYLNNSSYSGLVNFCSNLLYIYSLLLPVQDPIQNHLCIYLSRFFHSYQVFFHSKKFPQHFFVFLDLDSFEKYKHCVQCLSIVSS